MEKAPYAEGSIGIDRGEDEEKNDIGKATTNYEFMEK